MKILDRYARKPQTERRDKAIGSRLEKSLYDDFAIVCKGLGLTTSEAIRCLVLETVNQYKTEKDNQTIIGKQIENMIHTNNNEATTQDGRSKRPRLRPYIIDNQLPCPLCQTWSNRKHFNSTHAKKHGYESSYDLLQANLKGVNCMIEEKRNHIKE